MENGRAVLPSGLYALCDDGFMHEIPMVQKAASLLAGGISVMQLRFKRTPEAIALPQIFEIAALCRASKVACLVNDRADWALLAQASGVHLGQEDLPPLEARAILGPHALIGLTVRNLEDALVATKLSVNYVGLGPIFSTTTKKLPFAPIGTARLANWVQPSPLPIVAIGGIDESNIEDVARTGVWGAAVGSALYRGQIAEQARRLKKAFEDAGKLAGPSESRLP